MHNHKAAIVIPYKAMLILFMPVPFVYKVISKAYFAANLNVVGVKCRIPSPSEGNCVIMGYFGSANIHSFPFIRPCGSSQ